MPSHPDILPEPSRWPVKSQSRVAVASIGAAAIAAEKRSTTAVFLPPLLGSNAYHARHGTIPCETNPETGKLARMREGFHARATATIGADGTERRHVCESCRSGWHRFNKSEPGLAWGKVRGRSAAAMVVELTTLTAEDLDDEDGDEEDDEEGII